VNACVIKEQLLMITVVIALAHIQQAMDIQRINLDLLDLLDILVDKRTAFSIMRRTMDKGRDSFLVHVLLKKNSLIISLLSSFRAALHFFFPTSIPRLFILSIHPFFCSCWLRRHSPSCRYYDSRSNMAQSGLHSQSIGVCELRA
jgi:hypothetical protein